MALQKTVLYNGVEVCYWKICGINVTWTGKMAQIFILGFVNGESANNDINNKIVMSNYICKKEKFNDYFGFESLDVNNPLTSSYNFLKNEVDVFTDSTDV